MRVTVYEKTRDNKREITIHVAQIESETISTEVVDIERRVLATLEEGETSMATRQETIETSIIDDKVEITGKIIREQIIEEKVVIDGEDENEVVSKTKTEEKTQRKCGKKKKEKKESGTEIEEKKDEKVKAPEITAAVPKIISAQEGDIIQLKFKVKG